MTPENRLKLKKEADIAYKKDMIDNYGNSRLI